VKINIGIIGVGDVTINRHIPSIVELSDADAKIHALADIIPGRARQIADKYGIPVATEDYRDLLNNDVINAIAINTRIDSHKQLTIEALEAGKHVYLEKPATVNAQEMEDIMKAARGRDNLLLAGSNGLLQAQMLMFKDIIDSGGIGEMFMVSVERAAARRGGEAPAPVVGRESGISKHSASHNIEWALYFLGDPKPALVMAKGYYRHGSVSQPQPRPDETDEFCIATVLFDNGTSFCYKALRDAAAGEEYVLNLYGDMGTIEYDVHRCYKQKSDDCIKIYRDIPGVGVQAEHPIMETGKTHAHMYRHFFDCIRSGKRPISDGERALVVMRILDAIELSIKQGGRQVHL